jgi:hypothetical protein
LVDFWVELVYVCSTERAQKKCLATVLIHTAWNLWKERNQRIFDLVSAAPARIMALIKEEIKLRSLACGEGALPHRGF